MGPRWVHLGPILASWGLPGGLLGASLGLSGPSWGHPGHNVSQPYFLARLFHRSWALWGRFGALLGPSWDPFGALWGLSWASWGAPGPLLGFVWGPRGCIRGCMHSSPALFLSRWPGTSPFLYRRVYAKLCRTHFSRSLPHCLASSLQPLMQFILALFRHLSTATALMNTLCFYIVFVHFGFGLFRFVFSGLELHDAILCTRLCRWPGTSHVVPFAGYIKNCAAHFSPARCPTVFHHAFAPKRFLKPPPKSPETRGGGRSP